MFITLGPDITVNADHIKGVMKNVDGTARVFIDLELGMNYVDTLQNFDWLNSFLKTQGSKSPVQKFELKSSALDQLASQQTIQTP